MPGIEDEKKGEMPSRREKTGSSRISDPEEEVIILDTRLKHRALWSIRAAESCGVKRQEDEKINVKDQDERSNTRYHARSVIEGRRRYFGHFGNSRT